MIALLVCFALILLMLFSMGWINKWVSYGTEGQFKTCQICNYKKMRSLW